MARELRVRAARRGEVELRDAGAGGERVVDPRPVGRGRERERDGLARLATPGEPCASGPCPQRPTPAGRATLAAGPPPWRQRVRRRRARARAARRAAASLRPPSRSTTRAQWGRPRSRGPHRSGRTGGSPAARGRARGSRPSAASAEACPARATRRSRRPRAARRRRRTGRGAAGSRTACSQMHLQ